MIFNKKILATLFSIVLFGNLHAAEVPPPVTERPVPVIHITDLFRPHNDPDDHWDLACQYALAARGDIELVAVVIDDPKNEWGKDPDISAIAQLNYITGLAVPVVTGVPESLPLDADLKDPSVRNSLALSGIRAVHRILAASPRPVVITVTGWCRDLVFIEKYDPQLFAKKCAGIYLNAGLGVPDASKQNRLEWNTAIDKDAYRESLAAGAPIYWLPCFYTLEKRGQGEDSRWGSFYRFSQGDILPRLSDPMQNFFLSMFRDGGKKPGKSDWLAILKRKPDPELLQKQSARMRNMWCTGGMFHMTGKTVLADGSIVAIDRANDKSVYTFRPIRLNCDEQGRTSWKFDKTQPPNRARYIFEVRDTKNYNTAMSKALKSLILELGTRKQ
ncbi:MAG: hypothetical protein JXM70_06425 [Pirellulales bacterium]|nr:hypothetical protein [Pirellulales bacterium]